MSSSEYGIFRDNESYVLQEVGRRIGMDTSKPSGRRSVREALNKMGVPASRSLCNKPIYSGKLINMAIRHDSEGGDEIERE